MHGSPERINERPLSNASQLERSAVTPMERKLSLRIGPWTPATGSRTEDRINGCMERSMNGRALPLDSREMKAFSSFVRWLSTGVPDGAKLIGGGTLQIKEPARAADSSHGAEVFAQTYASCHGADGLGQHAATGPGYQVLSLWGPDSFNNGAGMSRLLTAAAYATQNMPVGTTFSAQVLTEEEAYDVAACFVGQKRHEWQTATRIFRCGFKGRSTLNTVPMPTSLAQSSTNSACSSRSAPRHASWPRSRGPRKLVSRTMDP